MLARALCMQRWTCGGRSHAINGKALYLVWDEAKLVVACTVCPCPFAAARCKGFESIECNRHLCQGVALDWGLARGIGTAV